MSVKQGISSFYSIPCSEDTIFAWVYLWSLMFSTVTLVGQRKCPWTGLIHSMVLFGRVGREKWWKGGCESLLPTGHVFFFFLNCGWWSFILPAHQVSRIGAVMWVSSLNFIWAYCVCLVWANFPLHDFMVFKSSLCRPMAVTLPLRMSSLPYPAVKGCFVWGKDVFSLDVGPLSWAFANISFSVLW